MLPQVYMFCQKLSSSYALFTKRTQILFYFIASFFLDSPQAAVTLVEISNIRPFLGRFCGNLITPTLWMCQLRLSQCMCGYSLSSQGHPASIHPRLLWKNQIDLPLTRSSIVDWLRKRFCIVSPNFKYCFSEQRNGASNIEVISIQYFIFILDYLAASNVRKLQLRANTFWLLFMCFYINIYSVNWSA